MRIPVKVRIEFIFYRAWVFVSPFWRRDEFSLWISEKLRLSFSHFSVCGGDPFRFLVKMDRGPLFGSAGVLRDQPSFSPWYRPVFRSRASGKREPYRRRGAGAGYGVTARKWPRRDLIKSPSSMGGACPSWTSGSRSTYGCAPRRQNPRAAHHWQYCI